MCLFGRIEESLVEKCYKEILNLTHNGESQRGYKPALAQYDIAKHVSEQFYSVDRNDVLSKDDIFSLIYILWISTVLDLLMIVMDILL